jgi:DNA-binding NarL/FixJ family response regulator
MVRILIADQSRLICDSLRKVLEAESDLYVVGCAATSEEVDFLLGHSSVVLLGMRLEDADGLEVLEQIHRQRNDVKVVVMGVNEDPQTILQFVEAGASGYILQNDSAEELIRKVEAIQEDRALVSPSFAALMMERLAQLASLEMSFANARARADHLDELTGRELEVLDLISQGQTNQEIAEELVIECGTVKNHVHNILKKLEAGNRHEAAYLYQVRSQGRSEPISSLAMAA